MERMVSAASGAAMRAKPIGGGMDFDADFVERVVPEKSSPELLAEHPERYQFATKYVRNSTVLDIGCGTGYGAWSLRSAEATHVVAIDAWKDAVHFPLLHYKPEGMEYLAGDARSLPLSASSVDICISFEAIEYVHDARRMMARIRRVLRSSGLLLLSTPNRLATNPRARTTKPCYP